MCCQRIGKNRTDGKAFVTNLDEPEASAMAVLPLLTFPASTKLSFVLPACFKAQGRTEMMLPRLFWWGLVPLVFLVGCGRVEKKIQQAEVSGKVYYQGKPLPGGIVKFVNSSGYIGISVIDPADGSYKLEAPVGEVKIAVDNRMLNTGGRQRPPVDLSAVKRERSNRPGGGGQVITGTFVPLPSHYSDPESSGLKYTVKKGAQTYDIELSDNPNQPPPSGH
jgi:hypothetical protein